MIDKKFAWNRWQRILIGLGIGYSLVCLALFTLQERLMFFPSRTLEHTPSLYQLEYQDVWISISQGERTEKLHGWWIPAQQPNAPVILYFHHNAINIGANVSQALQFHQLGYSIFLFDYRGFGQSQGAFPTEVQVYEDAQAVWNYLTQERKILPNQIVIYGHSIGGAIAIDLAARHPEAAALIVQSSFTSMRDMTKRFGLYWLLPVELILRQRFESLEKMKSVRMPVLIVTGTEDLQIPIEMGEHLYNAAPKFKKLIVVQGGGHDNHLSVQDRQSVKHFVQQAMWQYSNRKSI
ncbi:alpha/beta fold hydrolase [Tumidithrix elongata RA019]|uniref:Alpha/beta fold hydrolase n=1 Tax=Tumidithrix elongata BACA0141 TaxID=2716417 RepID=A0AAW9PY73_9CYAN|nr:alpha/beta fold hydrolase [Tumidithrix elongata RA019]